MRRVELLLIFLLLIHFIKAQSFYSLGNGLNDDPRALYFESSSNILYVGGNFASVHNGLTVNYIAEWNGNTWDSLGSGANRFVLALAKYQNQLYAGGFFDIIGGISAKGIGRWDGFAWHHFADITDKQGYSGVIGLYSYGTDLYAMGWIDSIDGIHANMIGRFDGTSWSAFPDLDTNGFIACAIIYNGELYVGGNFQGWSGKNDIAKWDGVQWVSVGGGFSGFNTNVNCMTIFQGKLYVGGYFETAWGDPGNNIAIWDGSSWSQPVNGVMTANVWAMQIFNGELYIGGQISDASGVPVSGIARWDGTQWYAAGTFDNAVTCFAANNNDLYIGGGFLNVNSIPMYLITRYSLPTAIDEVISKQELEISPNSTGTFYFKTQEQIQKAEVYSYAGQKVFVAERDLHRIDLTQSASGIYFYSITTKSGKNFRGKIVKE